MQIVFENHEEHAALREMVQLFSLSYTKNEAGYACHLLADDAVNVENGVLAQHTTSDKLLVYSTLAAPVERDVLRGKPSSEAVGVKTWLENSDIIIENSVPANRARRELKRQLYFVLSRATGIKWPWGSLTGIRPTQVANEVLQSFSGNAENSCKYLEDFFFLSEVKAQKAVETARVESRLLERLNLNQYLVYVGIPFCPSRCTYCSFITRDALRHEGQLSEYVDALCSEIKHTFENFSGGVSALYLGGGTPTSVSDEDFARLLETLDKYMPRSSATEITVEAGRPDTINQKKLELMREFGVHRLCINPQTMCDATLERVRRRHTVADVKVTFALARELGFTNINMDLIMGLPGESHVDFQKSLEELLALGTDSVTLHSLAYKRSSFFQEKVEKEDVMMMTLPQPDWSRAVLEEEVNLKKEGYFPYYLYRQKFVFAGLENTGFAKPGRECLYNVGMMSDQRQVIGLGSGSSSKRIRDEHVEKLYNSKDLELYSRDIEVVAQKKLAFFEEN